MPAMKQPTDAPRAIHHTEEERKRNLYSTENIQSALEGLHQDGLLLLKSVVDIAHIDHLREVMNAETPEILQSKERGGIYNQGVDSNILQSPPLQREDCLYEDVYFNPFVIQIANAYLGSTPIWNFTTGNNALKNTTGKRQPVHKDIVFPHPLCPFYFIANFPLSNFSPENGSTEFWLGSHAHTTSADQIPSASSTALPQQTPNLDPTCNLRPEIVEQRRGIRAPIQVFCEKGDVLIRDLRTWHAGMPNPSCEDRIMVAVGYQAPWYGNLRQRLFLPERFAGFFFGKRGGVQLEVRGELVEEGEEGRLWRNYGFGFGPSG